MAHVARANLLRLIRFPRVDDLLAAGLAIELLFISMNTAGLGSPYGILRLLVLGTAVGAISLAAISGAARRERRALDKVWVLALVYFAWVGTQRAMYAEALNTALTILGVVVVFVAARVSLEDRVAGLRRWVTVVVVALLLPALVGQGFDATARSWFPGLQGRYFGFSNPDALGFVAGLAIVLSIPVLSRWRGRTLFGLSVVLFAITASYTAAIATGLAGIAYFVLSGSRGARVLRWSIPALGAATIAGLIWISTDQGIAALESLRRHVRLSGRTELWAELMSLTSIHDYFWTGLGNRGVSVYTMKIMEVNSAHSTLLQMLLSAGFLTTLFFIVVFAVVAMRALSRIIAEPGRPQRLAFAVVTYMFVTSLVSTEPSAPVCISLIVVLVVSSPGGQSLVEPGPRTPSERDPFGWWRVPRVLGRRLLGSERG